MGVWPKFFVVSAVALLGTVLTYDLLVRRIGFMRFLFGMRPLSKTGSARLARQPV